jgi:putative peptidoglycan lipid II flippase
VGRLMVPAFFGYGVYQVNVLVNTFFATAERMPTGTLTSLTFADRVMELVLGGYAIAVATAILPMMSRQALEKDFTRMKQTFGFSLRIVSFITIPAMVGLVVLREPIIQVLFQHGAFVAESTELTARALLYYALGLPAFAAVKLIVPAFYSTQDTRTPVKVAFYALLLNIALNIVFLRAFFHTFQNAGPAFATSLAGYFNFVMLFVIFRQRFGRLGTFHLLGSLVKTTVASVGMGAVTWAMLAYSGYDDYTSFLAQLSVFVGMITLATLVFLGLAWLLRCPEIEEVYGIATRKDRAPDSGGG